MATVPPPPPELVALRARLAEIDQRIVDSIAERMKVTHAIAELKRGLGYPPFDRARELAHLDALKARGIGLGLAADVVRDVFQGLFSASRRGQRHLQIEALPRFSVGIVGGTSGMGAFLARTFRDAGYVVETTGLGEGRPAEDVARDADLVVVAVPIAATVDVVRRVGPALRDGACLMDVTSLKAAAMTAMAEAVAPGASYVGSHPMFGPSSGDFDRQKVVLCRGRGDAWYDTLARVFAAFGAEIVEADPAEHDRHMALIQVLVHEKTMVLGSTLERLKANLEETLRFASPIYRMELAMVGRMFAQNAALYADILTQNPEAAALTHVFEQESAHFARAISMADRDALVARFRTVAAYMQSFATWAKAQSDAILGDLIRHG